MQIYMRVCPICAKENKRESYHSNIYVPGWINYFNDESCADTICDNHKEQKLIKMSMTCEEFKVLRQISNDPSFMQSMNDLKTNDIIEYQTRMSQFRTQVAQQKNEEQKNKNILHCPKCNSTNIQLVKRKWTPIMGFMTNKVDRICVNCKHKF